MEHFQEIIFRLLILIGILTNFILPAYLKQDQRTVSYTHLDVYKRQIYSCAKPEWFLEIRHLEPKPVSWHIDRVKNLESWISHGLEMAQSSFSLHFRIVPSFSENRKDLAMATTLWADVERVITEEEKEAL